MKQHLIADYLSYTLFKLISPLVRVLPKRLVLFLGRRIGDLFYYFDCRHKAKAYSNIRKAFGERMLPCELSRITKKFYQSYGQNIMEMFLIPTVDKDYLKKYIIFEGLNYIDEGFEREKGVILAAVHAGSWELSNIICANLGFPFVLFVKEQGLPRLNALLNSYRIQKGCKVIQKENLTRSLINTLKKNESMGITVDQGASGGIQVKFFGKNASMSTGAVKLALKYSATIVPAFYTRINGPYIKTIIQPPFILEKTGEEEFDLKNNLQRLVSIFEGLITKYPHEYLWTYKTWKYSDERNVLILHDGKTGHLRQSEAVAQIIREEAAKNNIKVRTNLLEVKFRNRLSNLALGFSSCLSGKFRCQGCLFCLKKTLTQESYNSLIHLKPDIMVSCGSQVAVVNYLISRENLAKSVCLLRPSFLSTKKFDLVIMPKHDNPAKRANIVTIDGALNLINKKYLEEQSSGLLTEFKLQAQGAKPFIGVLIGGDSKNFALAPDLILNLIREIKTVAEKIDASILLTTSRRTSGKIENLIKSEFKDYSRCKLMIIANENNSPFAVGGILGLSQIVVTSAESISMVSEAATSGKHVLVFRAQGLRRKHQRFLDNLSNKNYIHLVEAGALAGKIEGLLKDKPHVKTLADNVLVAEAIKKIL